ncbi:PilZ domain-containing protein [Clostridium psychrophilum]|uniref:PilZ domain-containing protein n=1 Tax=Clostridium psychrophilum TaxID=132926 RepID=UPI001C0DD8B9|nr:PilZ domain-containing protein [Clostridium psychrophilum]MBU3181084.1 PilZ domain-containing protein [Clostridium psychrophilum]
MYRNSHNNIFSLRKEGFYGKSKRMYKRYQLNNFVAKMRVDKISNKSGISKWVTIVIENISQDGIQFITDIEEPIDEDIMLEFNIVIDDINIYAKGYALLTSEVKAGKYRYGVKLDIHDYEKEKIVQILDKVMDFSLEKGILTQECFKLKFNYAKPENHDFERRV